MELAMRVRLVLNCDESLKAKARYILSTFCKVLGLAWVEDQAEMQPHDGPTVWYGPAPQTPAPETGLIWIQAAPEAASFFAGHTPRRPEEITFVSWQGRRVPILFAPTSDQRQAPSLDTFLVPGSDLLCLPYDFIASAFYFLSCWEETVIPARDRHGRFPYAHSLAGQLALPDNIVDIYLDLFMAMLNGVGQGRRPQVEIPVWGGGASFVACLTHDVDEVGKPYLSRLKFMWDHLTRPQPGHRQTPLSERARFALTTFFSRRDPLWTFPAFVEMERQFGFTASYYFQAGGRNGLLRPLLYFRAEPRYALSEPRVTQFINELRQIGFEAGLHGTYGAGFDEAKFLQEKAILAELTGGEVTGHRQHYLRLNYATTLPIYERAGLRYDTTLGYAEQEGYRNQFSYPYHPYDHAGSRPYRFLELPVVMMDVSLGGYRELPASEAWPVIETWLERARTRRGCITLLWHNIWDGEFPGYFNLYPRALAWIHEHGGIGLSGQDVWRQWQER